MISRVRSPLAILALLAAAPVGADEQAAQVFGQASPSVFIVLAQMPGNAMSQGSAVVVAPGLLATNLHVVAGSERIQVGQSTSSLEARLEASDAAHDLALLRVTDVSAPPATFGDSGAVRVGETVYAIGSPRGLQLTLSEGIVSALRDPGHGRGTMIQTTAAISPGSSGGGLFDAGGRLIGLTTAQVVDGQNLNFAVPVEWLAGLGVEVRAGEPGLPAAEPVYEATAAPPALSPPAHAPTASSPGEAPTGPRASARRTLITASIAIVILLLLAKPAVNFLADRLEGDDATPLELPAGVARSAAAQPAAPDRLAPYRQLARVELGSPDKRDPAIWTEALKQTGGTELRALAAYVELRAQALYREELDRRWNKAQAQNQFGLPPKN